MRMANIDDILGKTKESPEEDLGGRVELNISCEKCFWPCDNVFYNKSKKVLTAICPEGHEMRSEIGMDWLVDGH